jgi:hypothetical protein
MRVIAIDWSGAKRGVRKKIWTAEFADGEPVAPYAGCSRDEIVQHLVEVARSPEPVFVGLDFAFSYPAWFVRDHGCKSAFEFWRIVERRGEEWLNTCPTPFWGRCGAKRPECDSGCLFRRTERETESIAGVAPKSAFQLAGPGHVGTGSLRGMPQLNKLREARFSIWPFDKPSLHCIVEIYPRILTGRVNKGNPAARAEFLSKDPYGCLPKEWRDKAASCEDAFDAAVSAYWMHRNLAKLRSLKQTSDADTLLEGLIWSPQTKSRARD